MIDTSVCPIYFLFYFINPQRNKVIIKEEVSRRMEYDQENVATHDYIILSISSGIVYFTLNKGKWSTIRIYILNSHTWILFLILNTLLELTVLKYCDFTKNQFWYTSYRFKDFSVILHNINWKSKNIRKLQNFACKVAELFYFVN